MDDWLINTYSPENQAYFEDRSGTIQYNNWNDKLNEIYNPYIEGGVNANNQFNGTVSELLNPNTTNPYQYDVQGIEALIKQYNENQNIPEYIETSMPTGPNYTEAQNSNLYKQLQRNDTNQILQNASSTGRSARGGATNLNIAKAASNNTANVANQLYQNDVNEYQKAQQNNQYRNQLLSNQLSTNLSLQSLKNQINQGNFSNNMNKYETDQNKLLAYIDYMNKAATDGLKATNSYGQLGTANTGSHIGTAANYSRISRADAWLNNANERANFDWISSTILDGLWSSKGKKD